MKKTNFLGGPATIGLGKILGDLLWLRFAAPPGQRVVRATLRGVALFLFATMMARAASLDDAHAAFAAGKYAQGVQGYQSVLDARGYSAPVLFDLGNSYFLEGKYPDAILAYKRALWLAPNDEDMAANLRLAEQQAGVAVDHAPAYMKVAGILSVNGWAWTACAAWTLLCGCLLLRAAWPARRGLLAAAGVLCAFVLADAIVAIILCSGGLREAVVVDKNPQALVSPFPGAQPVFTPAPGETVKIEKGYNDFLLVADEAGHAGWMAKNEIEPVVK
jgi:tetratricopeptide (TPR) repeat protein